jgi:hypothetical protein
MGFLFHNTHLRLTSSYLFSSLYRAIIYYPTTDPSAEKSEQSRDERGGVFLYSQNCKTKKGAIEVDIVESSIKRSNGSQFLYVVVHYPIFLQKVTKVLLLKK